jgi:hypothetical protein
MRAAPLVLVLLLAQAGSANAAGVDAPLFSEFCQKARGSEKGLLDFFKRQWKLDGCDALGARFAELTEINGFADWNGEVFPIDVSSLAVVRYMPKLRVVEMPYGSPVKDLRPLDGLDLVRLSITASKIRDLAPLAHMTHLEVLQIRTTKVKDLTPIMDLPNLLDVDLRNLKVPRAQIEAFKAKHPKARVTE